MKGPVSLKPFLSATIAQRAPSISNRAPDDPRMRSLRADAPREALIAYALVVCRVPRKAVLQLLRDADRGIGVCVVLLLACLDVGEEAGEVVDVTACEADECVFLCRSVES